MYLTHCADVAHVPHVPHHAHPNHPDHQAADVIAVYDEPDVHVQLVPFHPARFVHVVPTTHHSHVQQVQEASAAAAVHPVLLVAFHQLLPLRAIFAVHVRVSVHATYTA